MLVIRLRLRIAELQSEVRPHSSWDSRRTEHLGTGPDDRHEAASELDFGVAGDSRPLHPHRLLDMSLMSPRAICSAASATSGPRYGCSRIDARPLVRSSATVKPWRAGLGCFCWVFLDGIRSSKVCSAGRRPPTHSRAVSATS